MLLKELDVTNSLGDVLNLPLEESDSGFHIFDIKGTGPTKAVLVSSSFANMDGEQYHSSRRGARNLIITLGFNTDYAEQDVAELRDQLYSFFSPKASVSLNFSMFDRFATNYLKQKLNLSIDGYVESFESDMFTAEPQVDISIMCFQPDFIDPRTIEFDGMTVNNLDELILTYEGTVDTGVLFTFMPDHALGEFEIFHRTPSQQLRYASYINGMASGDVVRINSVLGDKRVVQTTGGVDASTLWAYLAGSAWLTLQPGDNSIRVYSSGAPIPYKIEYMNKYGGL